MQKRCRDAGRSRFVNVSNGLQQVYQRRANNYSFNTGELKGVIERNDRDRIYIGVWDVAYINHEIKPRRSRVGTAHQFLEGGHCHLLLVFNAN